MGDARGPTGTVDNEVPAARLAADDDPGHPPACEVDPVDDDAVLQRHVVQCPDPAPQHLLQQRPGHAQCGSTPVALRAVPPGLVDPGAAAVDPDRTLLLELVVDPGEPGDQQVQARGEQQMQVSPLGHVPPWGRGIGEPLPLQDDHVVDEVGQDPRGQEPRDARTDDDRGRHLESLAHAGDREKRAKGGPTGSAAE